MSEIKKFINEYQYEPQITRITSFPEHGHELNGFFSTVATYIGSIFSIAFILILVWYINNVVIEKEKKIREGLYVMGLDETAMMFSWQLFYFIETFVVALIITIILYNNYHILFINLFF